MIAAKRLCRIENYYNSHSELKDNVHFKVVVARMTHHMNFVFGPFKWHTLATELTVSSEFSSTPTASQSTCSLFAASLLCGHPPSNGTSCDCDSSCASFVWLLIPDSSISNPYLPKILNLCYF